MRVRVLKTSATPANEQALDKLLQEAELPMEEDKYEEVSLEEEAVLDDLVEEEASSSEIDDEEGSEEKEHFAPDDVYLVVLTPECAEDEEIDTAIRRAIAGGGQVIGIWPEGVKGGKLPPALDRLGASLVQWDASVLKETIVRGVPTWREPSGAYRPEPKTKRNRC